MFDARLTLRVLGDVACKAVSRAFTIVAIKL
jgi:hypothetical protein